MTRLTTVESEEVERDYVAHRAMVLAMLRADFRWLPDHEEVYQEAWTETLEIRARGEEIANTAGLLRTIAWRRARDRARKSVPDTLDPASYVFELQQDGALPPDEQAELRLDAAALRQIIDSLEPRHAAVLKLRFDHHLDAKEIQQRLGVSAKRLEKLVTEAYKRVQVQLGADPEGETPWARRQRSLLLVCEMGMASAEQRARAQEMVDQDPVCRAMLREMRTTLEGVAVVLPAPVLAQNRGFDLTVVLDRAGEMRDHAVAFVTRAAPAAPLEQATAGGLAGLGGGLAAKVAVACLVAGGGAVVCSQTGVFRAPPAPKQVRKDVTATARTQTIAFKPASLPREIVAVAPRTTTTKKRSATRSSVPRSGTPKRSGAAAATGPPPAVNAPAAPSPAPAGSTEFGPGAGGGAAAAPAPAQAPVQGGGEFAP